MSIFSLARRRLLRRMLVGGVALPVSMLLGRYADAVGSGAGPTLIFRLDDAEAGEKEEVVAALIEVFRRRHLVLDVGVVPQGGGQDSFAMPLLRDYLRHGVINISVHGLRHFFGEFRLGRQGADVAEETAQQLARVRRDMGDYYGQAPIAFTVPYDRYDRAGYDAIRSAGFRILSGQWRSELHPSLRPVDYDGHSDANGLVRLPVIRDVTVWQGGKGWGAVVPVDKLLQSVRRSLSGLDVAVLGVHPEAFVQPQSSTPDQAKLERLDAILGLLTANLTVTTFAGWYATHAPA